MLEVFLWDVGLRFQLINLFSEFRRDREKADLRDSEQFSCPKQLRVRRVPLIVLSIHYCCNVQNIMEIFYCILDV